MNNLKNLAGNDVSIFLFRFVLISGNAISFVINAEIGADMYQDLDEKLNDYRLKPVGCDGRERLFRLKSVKLVDESA